MKTLIEKGIEWSHNDVHDLDEDMSYAKIPMSMIHRKDISCKAKVIFAYMTSKGAGYQFASKRIANHFKEGYRTILSGINELEDAGYVLKKRLCDGRMHYELRENYWSLSEDEAKECLFEAFEDAFKPAVVEHEPVTFDQAVDALMEHACSRREAQIEATQFLNACMDARMKMNERRLDAWVAHVVRRSA